MQEGLRLQPHGGFLYFQGKEALKVLLLSIGGGGGVHPGCSKRKQKLRQQQARGASPLLL